MGLPVRTPGAPYGSGAAHLLAGQDVPCQFDLGEVALADGFQQAVVADVGLLVGGGGRVAAPQHVGLPGSLPVRVAQRRLRGDTEPTLSLRPPPALRRRKEGRRGGGGLEVCRAGSKVRVCHTAPRAGREPPPIPDASGAVSGSPRTGRQRWAPRQQPWGWGGNGVRVLPHGMGGGGTGSGVWGQWEPHVALSPGAAL